MREMIIFYCSIISMVQLFLAISVYMISLILVFPLAAKFLIQQNTKAHA